MKLFEKEYSAESLVDLQEDVFEAFNPKYNNLVDQILVDENGFMEGTFRVTIEWMDE